MTCKLALFLVALSVNVLPAPALGNPPVHYVSVSPAEVNIDDLLPGRAAQFELTIHNQEARDHVFVLSKFRPPERDRREGRAEFPEDSWISFSSEEIEVAAGSQADVVVTVAVPSEREWIGQDWEIWLGVGAESGDLLATRFYVRLLVSTGAAVQTGPDRRLIVGLVVAAVLLGYGARYFVRREPSRSGR